MPPGTAVLAPPRSTCLTTHAHGAGLDVLRKQFAVEASLDLQRRERHEASDPASQEAGWSYD